MGQPASVSPNARIAELLDLVDQQAQKIASLRMFLRNVLGAEGVIERAEAERDAKDYLLSFYTSSGSAAEPTP